MLRPGSLPAKVAALALLVLLLLVVGQFVVQPIIHMYQDGNDRLASAQERQQRYRALADEGPELAERLASFETSAGSATSYLEGPSDALAAAELQDLVSATISKAGGGIKATRILAASDVEDGPPLRKAGLVLQFSTELEGLVEALYDLESMEPQLFISNLVISLERPVRVSRRVAEARAARDGSADDGEATSRDSQRTSTDDETSAVQKFDVRLSIFGYVRQRA